jgi:hypothetical protein
MQPNKITTALGLGVLCLGVSGTSNAVQGSFPITASTLADVGLVQNSPISFGTNVFTTAGNCVLIGNDPSNADLQVDPVISGTDTNGTLSGTGCVGGAALGTAGQFTVTGISGADITVSMGSIPDTDNAGLWSFIPNRSVASGYGNATPTDSDDTFAAISSAAPVTLRLAATGDEDALVGTVVDQELVIFLGGTLSVLQPLTANQAYTGSFDLTVTY